MSWLKNYINNLRKDDILHQYISFIIYMLLFAFLNIFTNSLIFSSGEGNRSKNKHLGLHQTKKLLHREGKCQQNKKVSYWIGENICSTSLNHQGNAIQNHNEF